MKRSRSVDSSGQLRLLFNKNYYGTVRQYMYVTGIVCYWNSVLLEYCKNNNTSIILTVNKNKIFV